MNVVGYIRVSLDSAVNDFLDRNAQDESIIRWAHERNHRLVAVFCDVGVNASSGLETRLGLGDALQKLRMKEASGIVVARLDRLALSVVLQEELLAEIRGRNAHLFSASTDESSELTDDLRDPTRMLTREVVQDFPRFQSAMRDLWVRQRLRGSPIPEERAAEALGLIRTEELIQRGLGARSITNVLQAEGLDSSRRAGRTFRGLRRLVSEHRHPQ